MPAGTLAFLNEALSNASIRRLCRHAGECNEIDATLFHRWIFSRLKNPLSALCYVWRSPNILVMLQRRFHVVVIRGISVEHGIE
jgi:hypothetical protein